MRFIKVAAVDDVSPRRPARVVTPDDEIAVWNVNGQFFALSAICRHHHVPTLFEGMVEGLTVTCPLHGWTYSLETGAAVVGSGKLRRYDVNVKHGIVYVGVPDDDDS